ncbi:MAG TPA: arylsulfatase [Pirellulales bacterium]|nr:arylsulfatase [Pirellulales bacterium]
MATRIIVAVPTILSISAENTAECAESARRPNIVLILADDLGYGDLGCYGQKLVKTPNLDRLAAEGVRFTDAYAGSTVCAPSRCALMTGLTTGHGRVRGNALVPLRPQDTTVAEVLHRAGYATGIVGKWGLGEAGSTGTPNLKGFDSWFGYLDQKHAHNYYPEYLWQNDHLVPITGNVAPHGVATQRAQYSHDLFAAQALDFLDYHRQDPFFLYLAFTLPHANNEARDRGMEVPSDAPYSDDDWPQAQRNHAAMITRLDAAVGRLLARLDKLGLADDTIVFFSSDNGPHREGGADPAFFHSSGPLKGYKRSMHDGGIRVPTIVRWPGRIEAGRVDAFPWAFWDFLPTAAELSGAAVPPKLDGISILPELLGAARAGRPQQPHEYLYWEFYEGGFQQALRMGHWKAVRSKLGGPIELYDLATDLGESHDIAAEHPDVIAKIDKLLAAAHTDSPDFPVRPPAKKPAQKPRPKPAVSSSSPLPLRERGQG